jgi:conjugal transfer/type IV secretion protein DotA/TraY
MINLFQVAADDQSVFYLGEIFGMVGTLLPTKNPTLLMSMMFKVLNTTALTVGAALVVYVTVVGLLKTAQEGEFLGKQWNSLWVPLRTIMGIAALFPTASGYSAIQLIIMWIILQGVGAADALWETVIKYVSVAGKATAGVNSASMMPKDSEMKMLFQSLVCQASAKAQYPEVPLSSGQKVKYYCAASPNNPFCTEMTLDPFSTTSTQVGKNQYKMGPNDGDCGTLTYCDVSSTGMCADPTSAECLGCKAQHSALATIVPALGAVAEQFVNIDYQYLLFHEQGGANSPAWTQDYCKANNIPTESCCVVPPPGEELMGGATTTCTSSFKSYPVTQSDTDYVNVNDRTANELYLNYPFKTYLNGSDFINAAVGEYTAALMNAVNENIENQMNNPDHEMQDWQNDAVKYGWMVAGTFYYRIAKMNGDNQNAVNPTLVMEKGPLQELKNYRNNFTGSQALVNEMVTQNQEASATFSSLPTGAKDIEDSIGHATNGILAAFQSGMKDGDTNPLVSIASFGYTLMIVAQVLFVTITALIVGLTLVGTLNPIVFGNGLTMSPVGESIKAIANFFGPFAIILIVSLYSLGAMLGIYVPLIPYMIFTMGAIGWLIATIEAMVAGPIIALGILSPGGQHDILGRAEQSMMMLFNLFLRPVLMVFGLMAAMLTSVAVLNFVNSGFSAVTTSIISNPGLFEQIMFLSVYTSFIVAVLNKTFSLIYVIPERILTWIGGHAVQYGEAESLQGSKHAVESAAGGSTGASKEAGHAGSAGVMSVRGAEKGQKDQSTASLKKKEEDDKAKDEPKVN